MARSPGSLHPIASLIHAFFKPIGLVLAVVNGVLLLRLTGVREMEGETAALRALIFLCGALLSVFELQLILLLLGDRTFLFSLKERGSRLIVGGLVLAFGLAGWLAWQERSAHFDEKARSQREDEELRRLQRSPDVQRGAEMAQYLRDRAATRRSATQPAIIPR